jgi:D-sedoheptulose 7-phosphate isomerase
MTPGEARIRFADFPVADPAVPGSGVAGSSMADSSTPGSGVARSAAPGVAESALAEMTESALAESGLAAHLDQLMDALRSPETGLWAARRWGRLLAAPLTAGHRLLVAGNGGSAAEAQHLTAELVGRYVAERPPLSAIALHAETSSLTAIGNDYGAAEAFARQVAAHGRPGDTLLLLSASGRSDNVLAAADRARSLGIRVWAMTGPAPNPLASAADDAICVAAPDTSTVQEVHLVAIHALCGALDAEVTSL